MFGRVKNSCDASDVCSVFRSLDAVAAHYTFHLFLSCFHFHFTTTLLVFSFLFRSYVHAQQHISRLSSVMSYISYMLYAQLNEAGKFNYEKAMEKLKEKSLPEQIDVSNITIGAQALASIFAFSVNHNDFASLFFLLFHSLQQNPNHYPSFSNTHIHTLDDDYFGTCSKRNIKIELFSHSLFLCNGTRTC